MAGCPHVCARMGAEALREGALVQSVTTKGYAVGLSMAAFLSIAGCTGDTKPTVTISTTSPASSTPSTSEPTTGSGSSTTPSTSASTTAGADPNVPPAAKAQTISGAEEFSKYFATQLNRAFNGDNPQGIESLVLPSCKTCQGMSQALDEYRKNGWKFQGEYLHLVTVATFSLKGVNAEVRASTDQAGGSVVNQNGSTVTTAPRQAGDLALTLQYSQGWRIAGIQVLQ